LTLHRVDVIRRLGESGGGELQTRGTGAFEQAPLAFGELRELAIDQGMHVRRDGIRQVCGSIPQIPATCAPRQDSLRQPILDHAGGEQRMSLRALLQDGREVGGEGVLREAEIEIAREGRRRQPRQLERPEPRGAANFRQHLSCRMIMVRCAAGTVADDE
jgi:hypothetical protein